MKSKIVFATIVSIFAATDAHAHPSKCQHSHTSTGKIVWEEDCGGGRATSNIVQSANTLAVPEYAQHEMLLFGTSEIFASHIVYEAPHNLQVILRLELPDLARQHYLFLQASDPSAQIVLLLDSSDITAIESAQTIRGTIMKRGSSNRILNSYVTLTREEFKVVFFNQLPLNLDSNHH